MSDTVRRGHLIYAGGIGGLTVLKDGTAVICAGLDYWFRTPDGRPAVPSIHENTVSDWRLEGLLGVPQLRMPPATKSKPKYGGLAEPEVGVPFLRFPLWHVCPRCKRLRKTKSLSSEPVRCNDCRADKGLKTGPVMVQVPIVAACEAGHLDEFPWRKWLSTCECAEPDLRLNQRGGTGLSNYTLSCARCKKRRSMGMALQEGQVGECTGHRPWLYESDEPGCPLPFKGTLRNSASLYFPNVTSSVYLPKSNVNVPDGLREIVEAPGLATVLAVMASDPAPTVVDKILGQQPHLSGGYSRDQWIAALEEQRSEQAVTSLITSETDYRFAEWQMLSDNVADPRLSVKKQPQELYDLGPGSWLESVGLVEDLVVTKALTGFSRLLPVKQDKHAIGRQMWKSFPSMKERWLPAIQVRGEGIFIAFAEAAVREWEERTGVQLRVQPVAKEATQSQHLDTDSHPVSARFMLLHTFAHVLMNRLVFEAGYSAASLSERIYARPPSTGIAPMAAVLIYTASGDSEGSLGGLVRLGDPGRLERLIHDAIEGARWCSSDPICMELGGTERQGPDGLNLAACHACAHLPETACENFNVLLDRGLLIGSLTDPGIGFFN